MRKTSMFLVVGIFLLACSILHLAPQPTNQVLLTSTSFPLPQSTAQVSRTLTSSPLPQFTVRASLTSTAEITKQAPVLLPTESPTVTLVSQTSDKPIDCSNASLTAEEVANCGQHTYLLEGKQIAGDCYYQLPDGSHAQTVSKEAAYTIIFEPEKVKIYDGVMEQISVKTSPNTYKRTDGDFVLMTHFTLNGWSADTTWGACKSNITGTFK